MTVLTTTVVPLVSVDVLVREGGVVRAGGVVVGDVVVTTVAVTIVADPERVGVVPVVFEEGEGEGEGEGMSGERCVVTRREVEGMKRTH